MTWVRLADDFYDHPKVLRAGAAGERLFIRGLAYSNRYLTDGYLPMSAVRRLADEDDGARVGERLVAVGLWERAEDGFRIHDFAEYQPSAEAVRRERERNAERARTWRERRHSAGTPGAAGSTGGRNGVSALAPDPDPAVNPDPDPAGTPTPLPPSPQAGQGEAADAGGGGVRNQRRRRGQEGESSAPSSPSEVLADPTDDDRALWVEALAHAAVGITPANAELLARLEPAGRGADGGLRLRAPPGQGLGRFRGLVARALVDAGDGDGQRATIV